MAGVLFGRWSIDYSLVDGRIMSFDYFGDKRSVNLYDETKNDNHPKWLLIAMRVSKRLVKHLDFLKQLRINGKPADPWPGYHAFIYWLEEKHNFTW